MKNSITQGFASQENLLNTCAAIGLLDKSGGIIQIPGFYYPDLGERFKANVVEQYKLNIVGINQGYMLEEQIFAPQELYQASGHVTNFHDPAVRCLDCGERFRADHLIEDAFDIQCAGMKPEALDEHLQNINCPKCGGKLNETRNRSLMATMQVSGREYFLAPETAQHIFLHFRDGLRRNGGKLPFSLHQINTATRGEITMDLKRRRQFYQMEEEFFYLHSSGQTDEFHKQKISQYWNFFTGILGIKPDILRTREHEAAERSHYSSATVDIEAKVGGKWIEVAGIAHRGDFDLSNMERLGNKKLRVSGEIPNVIEPSVGLDRLLLAIIESAYRVEDMGEAGTRIVLGFKPKLAPYTAMVTALQPRDGEQLRIAREVDAKLRKVFPVVFDTTRSIGRRYRRADEIGIPFSIVVDDKTISDQQVTVRYRDSMQQVRIPYSDITNWLFQAVNE